MVTYLMPKLSMLFVTGSTLIKSFLSYFIVEVQRCANPVDIGLALDSSAGVRGRWSYMKNFALSMIDHFQMGDHARFGVVQFDTIAKFPIRLETYNDAEMLKVHIHKLMMNPFGKRRTDEALKIARDDLFRTARAGVRRAMVIVTNGRANGKQYCISYFLTHCLIVSTLQLQRNLRLCAVLILWFTVICALCFGGKIFVDGCLRQFLIELRNEKKDYQ